MKRKSNLYYKHLEYRVLLHEYELVQKSCRSDAKLWNFRKNLMTNIYDILNHLYNRNYQFSNYFIFSINEPKFRIIMSESISDKIVNHWLADYILIPALEPCLIDSNVATRKNKGAAEAYKLINKYFNQIGLDKNVYALKLDVHKFFIVLITIF